MFSNTILLVCLLFIKNTIGLYRCPSSIAYLAAHCDNYGIYQLSRNSGRHWQTLNINRHWPRLTYLRITHITPQTILKVTCIDQGHIGGFISTMRYNNKVYNTRNPLSHNNWIIRYGSRSSGSLIYRHKTSAPWHIRSSQIDNNAQWIWTRNTHNTLYFYFYFSRICRIPTVTQYIRGPSPMNYLEAYRYCRNLNSVLATIKSSQDNAYAVQRCGGSRYSCWIGFTDMQNERRYMWLDGSRVTYTRWARGEPNNVNGGEHCTHIIGNGLWNDHNCITVKFYPLCNPRGSRPKYSAQKQDKTFIEQFNSFHPENKILSYSFYLNFISIGLISLLIIGIFIFGCYYNCMKKNRNNSVALYSKVNDIGSDSSVTSAV